MVLLKKARKRPAVARDPKKEMLFRELSEILQSAGYQVRRERLKQGHGWKAVSGMCTHSTEEMIFVDRRLSQDDQIQFLIAKITSLAVAVGREQLELLPVRVARQLQAVDAVK